MSSLEFYSEFCLLVHEYIIVAPRILQLCHISAISAQIPFERSVHILNPILVFLVIFC